MYIIWVAMNVFPHVYIHISREAEMNRYFLEDSQMAPRLMQICSPLNAKEMQIKMPRIYHLTPVEMCISERPETSSAGREPSFTLFIGILSGSVSLENCIDISQKS